MFHKPTVFILGAGASWHYGYPTGEELVQGVIAKARTAANHFDIVIQSDADGIPIRPQYIVRNTPDPIPRDGLRGIRAEWDTAADECNQLVSALRPLIRWVIDYFLGQNPDLSDIGKLCIAWVLLVDRPAAAPSRN